MHLTNNYDYHKGGGKWQLTISEVLQDQENIT